MHAVAKGARPEARESLTNADELSEYVLSHQDQTFNLTLQWKATANGQTGPTISWPGTLRSRPELTTNMNSLASSLTVSSVGSLCKDHS